MAIHLSPDSTADPDDPRRARPSVSVVLPFFGDADDANATREALERIAVAAGDQIIVADNTPGRVFAPLATSAIEVVPAVGESSSYHARNVGCERAVNEWLLFLDADCRPPADILERYFDPAPSPEWGAVAGEVVGIETQTTLVARYQRTRGHIGQEAHVKFFYRPFGVTANLLVRRAAWESVGGFQEGVRSGADAEFCWRLQDVGWQIGYAPQAAVDHLHRGTIRQLARVSARYGAGRAWVNRRYPGSHPRPKLLRRLGRCAAGVVVWTASGQFDRARFKALDAVFIAGECVGYLLSNRPPQRPQGRDESSTAAKSGRTTSIVVWADEFPVLSETFVANEVRRLLAAGVELRVEAGGRPLRPERSAARELPTSYLEDDSIVTKLRDLAWLATRHPLRCGADMLARRRWAREEDVWGLRSLASPARRIARGRASHIHAHFAASAALNAMRVSRLLGIGYSVATHGYDIFRRPENLVEKHVRAAFAVSGCEYSVSYLRELVPAPHNARIHELIVGVDPHEFERRSPYPDGRRVGCVARLVEKKGLRYLIDAAAIAKLDRVTILGDGPLRAELTAQVDELGLDGTVELPGAADPAGVRAMLEEIDVFAMPCVIASDGDRDTMPVVVKEALAMGVPVVASDEVGLPELVRPEWGRLVPPGDSAALAEAIEELLVLPVDTRRAMGQAGRAFVAEHCNLERETARLVALIDGPSTA